MKRTHYNNGDEISLACGCDGCNPSVVGYKSQRMLVHEAGCPEAWRDYAVECKECGTLFYPAEKGQACCDTDCEAMYLGYDLEEADLFDEDYDDDLFDPSQEEQSQEEDESDPMVVEFSDLEVGASFVFALIRTDRVYVKISDTQYKAPEFDTPHTIAFPSSKVIRESAPDCSDEAFSAYLQCALWCSNDIDEEGQGTPLDSDFDESDIDEASKKELRKYLSDFLWANRRLLWDDEETFASDRIRCSPDSFGRDWYSREEIAAHDFWYTRNGHGTGFWDREGLWGEENARKLTEAANVYGEVNFYVGDDGKVYADE